MNEGEEDELIRQNEQGHSSGRVLYSSSAPPHASTSTPPVLRNMVAFWLLGLCNNFAYVVMLSAAKDILEERSHDGRGEESSSHTDNGSCVPTLVPCSTISTGAVLLADIIPSLTVKVLAPFTLHSVPYSLRHRFVVLFQASSLLIVAFSNRLSLALVGVVFASLGSGLGEVSYLSMSSHFHSDVVSSWSSGTGGAGIVGSLAFAVLTDKNLVGLRPRNSLLIMLVVPTTLFLSYVLVLQSPPTMRKVRYGSSRLPRNSKIIKVQWRRRRRYGAEYSQQSQQPLLTRHHSNLSSADSPPRLAIIAGPRRLECLADKWAKIRPLLRFMAPLTLVYLAEYFINQGLLELLVFSCARGLQLSPSSQYRWYQVLYQLGVFISRSSVKTLPIAHSLLPFLAVLQLFNVAVLFNQAMHPYIPHILLLFSIIFYEGLLGGAAYANTFSAVHKTIPRATREFSMGFVGISDSLGIVMAGFSAIAAHNFICSRRL